MFRILKAAFIVFVVTPFIFTIVVEVPVIAIPILILTIGWQWEFISSLFSGGKNTVKTIQKVNTFVKKNKQTEKKVEKISTESIENKHEEEKKKYEDAMRKKDEYLSLASKRVSGLEALGSLKKK